jgi:hypothetical protein
MEKSVIEGDYLITHIQNIISKYRQSYGKLVRFALGQRKTFSHHADLEFTDEEVKLAKELFDLSEDDLFDKDRRHHPFVLMCATIHGWDISSLKLIPGETYRILQDGDDEVAVVVQGTLAAVPGCTNEQTIKFIEALAPSWELKNRIMLLVQSFGQ